MRWFLRFCVTLEEISDSDLLVHVVDASNPRVVQQIESVAKILTDLKLNSIPQIIVLNKSDLATDVEIRAAASHVCLDKPLDCVSISAIKRETLRPLVESIAARIGRFAVSQPG